VNVCRERQSLYMIFSRSRWLVNRPPAMSRWLCGDDKRLDPSVWTTTVMPTTLARRGELTSAASQDVQTASRWSVGARWEPVKARITILVSSSRGRWRRGSAGELSFITGSKLLEWRSTVRCLTASGGRWTQSTATRLFPVMSPSWRANGLRTSLRAVCWNSAEISNRFHYRKQLELMY